MEPVDINTDLVNEVFEFRPGERPVLYPSIDDVPEGAEWRAVRLAACEMPPGDRANYRNTCNESAQFIVTGCWRNPAGAWQWVHFAPNTKEMIGDLIFDSGIDRDRWWYMAIEHKETEDETETVSKP